MPDDCNLAQLAAATISIHSDSPPQLDVHFDDDDPPPPQYIARVGSDQLVRGFDSSAQGHFDFRLEDPLEQNTGIWSPGEYNNLAFKLGLQLIGMMLQILKVHCCSLP